MQNAVSPKPVDGDAGDAAALGAAIRLGAIQHQARPRVGALPEEQECAVLQVLHERVAIRRLGACAGRQQCQRRQQAEYVECGRLSQSQSAAILPPDFGRRVFLLTF